MNPTGKKIAKSKRRSLFVSGMKVAKRIKHPMSNFRDPFGIEAKMNIPTKDPGIKPIMKYLITTHLICLKKKAKREQLLINWKAACKGTM